jgi:hypothetical protein
MALSKIFHTSITLHLYQRSGSQPHPDQPRHLPTDTTDQFKTSLDILNAQADTIAPAAERFSNSQWGSTPKPKAANHLIELPLFPTQDIITAADVQPFRKSALRYRPAFWML